MLGSTQRQLASVAYQVNTVATGIGTIIDQKTSEMRIRESDMSKPHIVRNADSLT